MRSERSRRVRLLVACAGAASLCACEIDQIEIPVPPAMVSMHGVLSATAPTQVVLLERTRNGSVTVFGSPFDLADPVVSDRGIAESGATVRLVTPAGETMFAREDNTVRDDRKGAGIYRFAIAGADLQRGAPYRILVTTATGEELSAATTVPDGTAAVGASSRTFDRSRDTVVLEWPAAAGARAYFVRVESPFGPHFFFTESTSVRLTGSLRNAEATGLPHLFVPGFPQAVTVSAVDSNYYDWFRTHSNTISGEGLINRVSGGIGVFGSLVRIRFENWDVTAPMTESPGGVYRLTPAPGDPEGTMYLRFDLFLESRSARGDQPDALSGRYYKRPVIGAVGCQVCGLLGTIKDGHVRLALLNDWFAQDTTDIFEGELRGDTLVGSYRFVGPARFVRDK